MNMLTACSRWIGVALLWTASAVVAADPATNRFGFTGPEIFPIDSQIGLLHAADMDGDGLTDLVLVNNSRSKINLLYNRTGKTNAPAAEPLTKRELNELPPDARFRIDSIPSEKRISGLAVTDLNGDGRPDLAYYGEPKELVVVYNQGTNGWSTPKRWPIDDGQLSPNALTAGDLNGDGRTDLVLLAETHAYLIAQDADHNLGEAAKIPLSSLVRSVQVIDLDNDGRNDLLLVNFDSPTPFRFRRQQNGGQLGPEVYFKLPPIHSYCADQLEGDQQGLHRLRDRQLGPRPGFDLQTRRRRAALRRLQAGPVPGVAPPQDRQVQTRFAMGRRECRWTHRSPGGGTRSAARSPCISNAPTVRSPRRAASRRWRG